MAVYEGARPRTITLGGRPRIAEGPTLKRRRARAAVRAGRHPRQWSLVLGAIVIAFLLAFFWLAQVVRESATGYDIGRLQVTRDRLDSRSQDLHSDLSRLGHEPAIRKLALDAGLGQLSDPLILPAR